MIPPSCWGCLCQFPLENWENNQKVVVGTHQAHWEINQRQNSINHLKTINLYSDLWTAWTLWVFRNYFRASVQFSWSRIFPLYQCPSVSAVKESVRNAGATGDRGLIPGLGRTSAGGHGNPLLFSCLENPMDRGAWQAIVHRVAKSWTRLKQLSTHATMHSHPGKWRQFQLEKARKIYIIKVVIVWWVPSSKGPGLPFMTRVLGLWICLSGNWLKG